MEVISLGMPRTGTASMQAALRLLGYNDVYHGFILVDQPLTSNAWEVAVDAKFHNGKQPCSREMFDDLFKGFSGTTDTPAAFFAEDLIKFYPEAKFILVERDVDRWLTSFKVLIDGMYGLPGSFVLSIDNILGYAGLRTYRKLFAAYFHSNDPKTILANAPQVYREHYSRVRELVPRGRLLEYELGSGWEPLCEFLGREVPRGEIPWINETKALQRKMGSVMAARAGELVRMYSIWLVGLGVGLIGVWTVWR